MTLVDLSRISKPNITPPSIESEPDYDTFIKLENKYQCELNKMLDDFDKGVPIVWLTANMAIIEMLFLNYQSISNYMDSMIYNNINQSKKGFENGIRTFASAATFGAWIIGKEFKKKYPNQTDKFLNKSTIDIKDIPFKETQILLNAVYLPYYMFALIFTNYYDSEYGKNVRSQKDGHLKDTYQSMMKGILGCFLEGIKS